MGIFGIYVKYEKYSNSQLKQCQYIHAINLFPPPPTSYALYSMTLSVH